MADWRRLASTLREDYREPLDGARLALACPTELARAGGGYPVPFFERHALDREFLGGGFLLAVGVNTTNYGEKDSEGMR